MDEGWTVITKKNGFNPENYKIKKNSCSYQRIGSFNYENEFEQIQF